MTDSDAFHELLTRCQSEDLTDVEASSAVQFHTASGSAPVLTITPSYLDTSADLKRALLLLIRLLNPYLSQSTESSTPYHVIYVHSGFAAGFHHLRFLFWAYRILPRRYKKNLTSLSVIHPTPWVRLFFLIMKPTLGDGIWDKLQYCDGIDELYLDGIIGEERMEEVLPRIAFEKEKENKLRYQIRAENARVAYGN